MRLNNSTLSVLSTIPGIDMDKLRIATRAADVKAMWKKVVDDIFLQHTNSVYIVREGEAKILHVYMDDSVFAAEINARRELIKAQLKLYFNEDIEEFHIHISRGRYKKEYPFRDEALPSYMEDIESAPLDEDEVECVNRTAGVIPDGRMKETFKKAMAADLERKKGEKLKKSSSTK